MGEKHTFWLRVGLTIALYEASKKESILRTAFLESIGVHLDHKAYHRHAVQVDRQLYAEIYFDRYAVQVDRRIYAEIYFDCARNCLDTFPRKP